MLLHRPQEAQNAVVVAAPTRIGDLVFKLHIHIHLN